ncbi:MAG: T9SS type A sorting domain-containing protein [Bacteroidetes bacterium]|nr:T9SS type A sorting domain-containing protein [Bacteroidota bacterium]MCW5897553.1 T9SS type A sorting domain-containing protein [Bacteroidota bacterium]
MSLTFYPSHPIRTVLALIACLVFVTTSHAFGPDTTIYQYSDNFESYNIGQRLACQNPTNWTTWSLIPCDSLEDPMISGAYAYSGTKSVVISQHNDLVIRYSQFYQWPLSTIRFKFLVPTGKRGYFNTLATFSPPGIFNWAMEVYFDSTGQGRLFAGTSTPTHFGYTQNVWHSVKIDVNLGIDSARFSVNDDVIRSWRWTLGASGGTSPLRLEATNFYGFAPKHEMYIDDFDFRPPPIQSTPEGNGSDVPKSFDLSQNYPNPFNPATTIQYALPNSALVTLKIYNLLGQEMATLVDQTKPAGYHTAVWDGRNQHGSDAATGVYLCRIEAIGSDGATHFRSMKKMLLVR